MQSAMVQVQVRQGLQQFEIFMEHLLSQNNPNFTIYNIELLLLLLLLVKVTFKGMKTKGLFWLQRFAR